MPKKPSFQQVLEALADTSSAFPARFAEHFSDLAPAEVHAFRALWPKLGSPRKHSFLTRLQEYFSTNTVVSFDSVAKSLLNDADPIVRAQALQLLMETEDPKLIPLLLNLFERDGESVVRQACAKVLGNFVQLGELDEIPTADQRLVEEALIRAIHTNDAPLQRQALESLGYSSRPEAAEEIDAAYKRHDPQWIASALLAMGRSADPRWNEAVLSQIEAINPTLRLRAVQAVGELGIKEARQYLFNLLDEEDEDEIYGAAIWSLSQIGGEDVREYLETLIDQTEDDDQLAFLEEALENLDFTEDMERLDLLAIDPDEEISTLKKKKH